MPDIESAYLRAKAELERQAESGHYDAPWLDFDYGDGLTQIDGVVDLRALAVAILSTDIPT